ncbi:hypothetical protein LTR95_018179 [Oleoguttula sp. CCFEE 5521]
MDKLDSHFDAAGNVQVRRSAERWIDAFSSSPACFRNIDLSVIVPDKHCHPRLYQIKIRLTGKPPMVSVDIEDFTVHNLRKGAYPEYVKSVDRLITAISVIEQRPGFRGLSLHDLREMAMAFKCPLPWQAAIEPPAASSGVVIKIEDSEDGM